jgi:hypothetical protein
MVGPSCLHFFTPLCACGSAVGLEGGRLLPAELQCDPGTSGNAAMAEQLQRLPDSLTAALECWGSDTQLQVRVTYAGRGGGWQL